MPGKIVGSAIYDVKKERSHVVLLPPEKISNLKRGSVKEDPIDVFDDSDDEKLKCDENVDVKEDYEIFKRIITELCDTGLIELIQCSDDISLYKAQTGIKWSDVILEVDPIKRKIMLQLVQNPKTFFVLQNTQKGKLRIIGKEIASWLSPQKKVVSYLVVANDRTLSEQSVNGLFSCFPLKPDHASIEDPLEKYNVRIFELSSNNKISLTEILQYIDAYASPWSDNAPPLIIVLANPKQIEKLVRILHHVIYHRCPNLYAGGGWDEADATYPQYREKTFQIGRESVNFINLLNHPSERIIRNGFVTATEGNLLDEDYEECANAHHYQTEIDPVDQEN
jgi:hypothetical protein